MDVSKRKADDDVADRATNKASRIECPHSVRCDSTNPHQLRDLAHPHLEQWLDLGDWSSLPDCGLPQPKTIYIEQLKVMRSLHASGNLSLPPCTSHHQSSSDVSAANFLPTTSGSLLMATNKAAMLERIERAKPYNLFYNVVPQAADTLQPAANCITFDDLLCPSLGVLKSSLQINFIVDFKWLMQQYRARNVETKPLTVIYDHLPEESANNMKLDCLPSNVTHFRVKLLDRYGTHHSKVGIYVYDDNSMRVCVSTANLFNEDWTRYNQGLWLSPVCRRLPVNCASSVGESPTGFKAALLAYLRHYKVSCLNEWIARVARADFRDVRVFLVVSMPGNHYPNGTAGSHLHTVADLLSRYCTLPMEETSACSEGPLAWSINAQASSIGSFGSVPTDWLRSTLLRSLAAHNQSQLVIDSSATLNVIYPTFDNVQNGLFGIEGGRCLPYRRRVHESQRWLEQYLHQWKADSLCRSGVMPHIKTYCRVSPDLTKLAWFLMTSANISKAAWGGCLRRDHGSYVSSYEAGVMFLPRSFDQKWFEIAATMNNKLDNSQALFPFIYDLPLTCYKADDYPYCN